MDSRGPFDPAFSLPGLCPGTELNGCLYTSLGGGEAYLPGAFFLPEVYRWRSEQPGSSQNRRNTVHGTKTRWADSDPAGGEAPASTLLLDLLRNHSVTVSALDSDLLRNKILVGVI